MAEFNLNKIESSIGIFGGTFDPPHIGHLILAEEALYQLGLSKVLWVITTNPPHKSERLISNIGTRIRLVEAAIRSNPAFELSKVDIDRAAPHYAVDTLKLLTQMYPDKDLIYLIGGDSLRDLPSWYKPKELLGLCSLVGVMRRPNDHVIPDDLYTNLPALRDKLRWIETPQLDISASLIRHKIKGEESYQYYLYQDVYEIIAKEGLYK